MARSTTLTATDTITNLVKGGGGDALALRDVVVRYSAGNFSAVNFVGFVESGGSTMVSVNADGAGTDFMNMAILQA